MSHSANPQPKPARYVMIGGFLGAGKTTAIRQLAEALTTRGQQVGLITNDQSTGLVDTSILRSHGYTVEEITGGCFCCRFDSLSTAAENLSKKTRPDVFIAEPVGSCTDLLATVSYPLRRIYGDRFRIAPLSVLVDPMRAARILGLSEGRSFSPKVVYVYKKQLEEANILVVNKCDTLDAATQTQLVKALENEFPRAEVLCISAKNGTGLDAWFQRLDELECPDQPTMDLDYDLYAEGEALLGWLNATLKVQASQAFDGNALVVRLAASLKDAVRQGGGEIAHLKATLESQDAGGQLSVVSVVSSMEEPDLRESLLDACSGGSMILNLRAEMDPESLSQIVTQAIEQENTLGYATLIREHEERFRPARPIPTHRITVS
jgi:G3E family GTPase